MTETIQIQKLKVWQVVSKSQVPSTNQILVIAETLMLAVDKAEEWAEENEPTFSVDAVQCLGNAVV